MPRRTSLALLVVSLVLTACGTATASPVVLGSAAFAGTGGEGWGTAAPHRIYNGGDPSGLLKEVHWASWGGSTATGFALNAIFKPQGGYYPAPVLVELRASGVGHCTTGGPAAYTHLSIRGPERPEGPWGSWHAWSGAKSICRFAF